MLDALGVPVTVLPIGVDDGRLRPGRVTPGQWVMALAYFKARWGHEHLGPADTGTILGADTVCVHGGRILGQPRDAAHARAILGALRDAAHVTITGVCLLERADRRRWMLVDRAAVRVGPIPDDDLDAYVASGQWRGKAGGYNLEERIEAGWPITCDGDPATVMGLPLRRLEPWLDRMRGVAP
jgi:septum formation protein